MLQKLRDCWRKCWNGPTMYIKLTSYLMCGPNSHMERQITFHTQKNKGINRWSLSNLRPLGLELWQWRYYQIEINTVLLTKVKHVLPFVLTIALRKQHLWEGGMFSTIVELFQKKKHTSILSCNIRTRNACLQTCNENVSWNVSATWID